MIPNIITYNEWQFLKQFASLTKGFKGFLEEELDEAVVFYDEEKNYLDYLERKKIENIIPAFVLLPRFFWETHKDTIPDEFSPTLNIKEKLNELNTVRDYKFYFESRRLVEEHPMKLIDGFELRPEQKPVIDFFINELNENNRLRGVLQAAPGVGKTAMSITLLAGFRARGLIIVPNEPLTLQWVEAILQFTNLKEEDIGLIQGSDLGANEEAINKPISIIKIQSLFSQIKRNKVHELQQFYKYKEIIVYDECHNSGAATSYAKTSSLFTTSFILGLTATPYRQGLNDYLLKASIGETVYKVEHQNLIPDIEIHKIYTPFSDQEQKRLNSLKHDYNMVLGVFNSFMNSKSEYFNYIADVINWNFLNNHNVVILLPTIKLMENLQKILITRHPELTPHQILLKGKTKEDMMSFVKIKRKEIMEEYKNFKEKLDLDVKNKNLKRKDAQKIIKERRKNIDEEIDNLKIHALDLYKKIIKEARIVISNPNLLSAGYDDPKLSNLIIAATPRIGAVPVIQSIGRITRLYENKPTPLVQYFIPAEFYKINKSVNIILTNNIKKQYPEAKIKYIGMDNA